MVQYEQRASGRRPAGGHCGRLDADPRWRRHPTRRKPTFEGGVECDRRSRSCRRPHRPQALPAPSSLSNTAWGTRRTSAFWRSISTATPVSTLHSSASTGWTTWRMAGPPPSPAPLGRRARFLDLVDFPVQAAAGALSPAPLRPGRPRPGLYPHPDGGDQRPRPAEACPDGRLHRPDLEARLPGVAATTCRRS